MCNIKHIKNGHIAENLSHQKRKLWDKKNQNFKRWYKLNLKYIAIHNVRFNINYKHHALDENRDGNDRVPSPGGIWLLVPVTSEVWPRV